MHVEIDYKLNRMFYSFLGSKYQAYEVAEGIETGYLHAEVPVVNAMSLSLYGVPDGQESEHESERAERLALPIRILTCFGARVALQRCPILRAGRMESITSSANQTNSASVLSRKNLGS